ncbi:MAG: ubiquitin-activating E1 FCCH domain-containing protein [Caulobacter sp.]
MHHASHQPGPGLLAPIARLLRGFRNESGAVAIWFALLALPIAVLAFALIDVNRASVEKRQLQDALDAATLMAARSTAATDSELQAVGAAALVAQLSGASDSTLASSTFRVVGTKVVGTATAKVVPVIASLWLQGDMTIGAEAEVARASTNLEVSLVLDITGSMRGSKIADMRTAAKDLVDSIVADVQTPYYSKVALVPFSVGVNLGGYADDARGAVRGARSITGASWTTGSSRSISGVSKANPAVVTSNGHGFGNGDVVWITGVKGMTQLNDRAFIVANRSTNSFQLQGVNSGSYKKYKSGGTIRKCQVSDCSVVITAAGHGLGDGEDVYITGVGGMTDLNGEVFTVANKTTNTFVLAGVNGANFGTYSSGGSAWCLAAGCQYYQFTNNDNDLRRFEITTCATERVGADAYTDTAPGTSPVGRHYTENADGCPSASIVPLSSDKTALKAVISGLTDGGATAGQIGTAWGWYMVSPNFGSLWPTASRPSAYDAPDVLKVVIIMTDGEFNTAYCNGVLSRDSMGSDSQQINCNATNGDETAQALALCAAMKAKDIVVYTVGFQLGGNRTAENFINSCATDSSHVFLPSSGAALKDAFAAIGRDILKLRLSR